MTARKTTDFAAPHLPHAWATLDRLMSAAFMSGQGYDYNTIRDILGVPHDFDLEKCLNRYGIYPLKGDSQPIVITLRAAELTRLQALAYKRGWTLDHAASHIVTIEVAKL